MVRFQYNKNLGSNATIIFCDGSQGFMETISPKPSTPTHLVTQVGGRCEVWTREDGIRASIALEHYTCLRFGVPAGELLMPLLGTYASRGRFGARQRLAPEDASLF